jgi:effector-binding domain-containing protein
MSYEISVRDVPDQWIVTTRQQLTVPEIPGFIGESYGRIFGLLGRLGIEASAPPFVIYHHFGPGRIDAEAAVPIAKKVTPTEGLKVRKLHAANVAWTLHVGPYEALGQAYEALTDWIADHGREATGPVREHYLNGPAEGVWPTDFLTEIEMPVSEARVAVPA